MNLYILRHGDASQQSTDDASRPLTSLGEQQAEWAAKALRSSDVAINLILSSPLLRAIQTAGIVQRELKVHELRQTDWLLPGTEDNKLISEINSASKSTMLLVGHEPHLSMFTSLLISGTRNSQIDIKKGGLLCLNLVVPIQPGAGTLKWLLKPDQMKILQ